jgi:NAD(P)-dependent dehydrogenase (short-subunit alcohol dehydrogenase family)
MGLLDGKNAVVTGAGRGIGRAYSLAMAKEGANVVVNDVDGEEAEKVVKEIEALGQKAVADTGSVADYAQAEALIQKCVDSFGRIDILLNNAGILRDRMSWNMSEEEWDAVIAVHLKGTFNCARHAMVHMRAQQGGTIINVTSGAHYGNTGQSNYAAAKGGIASATYTWAMELARYGVRVNCISPSARTRMTDSIPDAAAQLRASQGLGRGPAQPRRGEPEEVAPLAVWLASDETSNVSGQIFYLGGDKFALVSHPKDVHISIKPGGWTVQDIVQHVRVMAGSALEPVGIGATTYQWYDGVKPRQQTSQPAQSS